MIGDEEKSRAPLVMIVGVVAAVIVGGAIYLIGRMNSSPAPAAAQVLPMGPAEQAYVPQIQLLQPQVTRAANFLDQEVTFVWGTVQNNGTRPIKQIQVTLEFQDPFKEVVLRDTRVLFSPTAAPLDPHQQRDFELDYDSVPAEWNQTYPVVHITGLLLQ